MVVVVCLVLVSFGYTSLPFFPQGKDFTAYFTDASGIAPGSDVQVSGIKVGKVKAVSLAGANAKIDFTVDRKLKIGNQSLAAIRTETVLGEKALAITPAGSGAVTVIPVERTSTPYTLNIALQDLGGSVGKLDKPRLEQALSVLTDSLHQATPQLRGALDGVAALSRTLNARDEAFGELLGHAKSVTGLLSERADQVTKLVDDGNQLFASLDRRRQALANLVGGIQDVSTQISGLVADNRAEIGPALTKLNLVFDNLLERKEHISEALRRLPGYATALGEVVGSAPGFQINLYGLPPATMAEVMVDAFFQPGKLPDSLSDYLRGMIAERVVVRPRSP